LEVFLESLSLDLRAIDRTLAATTLSHVKPFLVSCCLQYLHGFVGLPDGPEKISPLDDILLCPRALENRTLRPPRSRACLRI
jgi:hypothetical protein